MKRQNLINPKKHLFLISILIVLLIFITCSTVRKLNSYNNTNNVEKFIIKILPNNIEDFFSNDVPNSIFIRSDVKTIDTEEAYEFILDRYNNFNFSRLSILDIKKYAEPLILLEEKDNIDIGFNKNLVIIHIAEEDFGYNRTNRGCLIIYNGEMKKVTLVKKYPELKETDYIAIGGFLLLMIYVFFKISAGAGLSSLR